MSATTRLEVRIGTEAKGRIEHAAALTGVPVSDFVRAAAENRAEAVLAEYQTQTGVPAEFFDALLDALDAEPPANKALAEAAELARTLLER